MTTLPSKPQTPIAPIAPGASVAATPRLSSTVVVVRDTPTGLQVLLLKRADKDDANGGAWVFPGGLVDAGDEHAARQLQASDPRWTVAAVTAVRECFEECGLLYARSAAGASLTAEAVVPWQRWREPLNRAERSMLDFMGATGFSWASDAMVPLARWVTPKGMRKRFDTHFFVARAPQGQPVSVDGAETVEHRWFLPSEALAQGRTMKLLTPTRDTLTMLAQCATVDEALAKAPLHPMAEPIMPRLGRDVRGVRPVTPDELAYAEIGRLDPNDLGTVACTIEPGVAVRLSARVIRVTAPNPGVMTGPGTNSYLVGGGGADDDWAVIDPGPDIESHLQALLAAAPGPIRWVFVTHTHRDHSPLARRLALATGAQVLGRVADHAQWQDESFVPDVLLSGGEVFSLGRTTTPGNESATTLRDESTTTLRVVHTPGHASNHLCYRLDEEATLFTGDHVMQKATVVINPPDGDMTQYIESLQRLAVDHHDLQWLAPGHGFLMDQPVRAFGAIVAHRLRREAKVVASLTAMGPVAMQPLVASVYDEVPLALHGVAERSLTAHLIKLQAQGLAACDGDGRWALVPTS